MERARSICATRKAKSAPSSSTPSLPRSITGEAAKLRDLAFPPREADLADLIELLRPEQRTMLIATLGEDFDAATLPELDEAVRDQVLETMPSEQVAEALQQLDSDDAVYVIEDLNKEEQT